MTRIGTEKREEMRNGVLNNQVRSENIKVYSEHTSQNARNAIDGAFKKAEGLDIEDACYKKRLDIAKALKSISDRIRMAEEKNNMEAKK